MQTDRQIEVERHGASGVIRLARPDALNAYTPDMGDELVGAFRALAGDADVAAIVLTGRGRAFCVGADRAFLNGEKGRNGLSLGQEEFIGGFAAELFAIGKPTIAAINGPAVGLGATMLLPFDFRIAANSASFSFPFARLGLMPGMGFTFLLPAIVGPVAARQIMLGSAKLDSVAAHEVGLVDQVVPDDRLEDESLLFAASFAHADAATLAAMKSALVGPQNAALKSAIDSELRAARERLAARVARSKQDTSRT